jgi:hypothetical protein
MESPQKGFEFPRELIGCRLVAVTNTEGWEVLHFDNGTQVFIATEFGGDAVEYEVSKSPVTGTFECEDHSVARPLTPRGDFLRRWHGGETGWPR